MPQQNNSSGQQLTPAQAYALVQAPTNTLCCGCCGVATQTFCICLMFCLSALFFFMSVLLWNSEESREYATFFLAMNQADTPGGHVDFTQVDRDFNDNVLHQDIDHLGVEYDKQGVDRYKRKNPKPNLEYMRAKYVLLHMDELLIQPFWGWSVGCLIAGVTVAVTAIALIICHWATKSRKNQFAKAMAVASLILHVVLIFGCVGLLVWVHIDIWHVLGIGPSYYKWPVLRKRDEQYRSKHISLVPVGFGYTCNWVFSNGGWAVWLSNLTCLVVIGMLLGFVILV